MPEKLDRPDTKDQIALAPAQVRLDLGSSEGTLHSRIFKIDQFYLTPPTPAPDSPALRFVDAVFTPEVFHFKKVSIKCPIATAIKRKNPLSLLSGLGVDPDDGGIAFRILQLEW